MPRRKPSWETDPLVQDCLDRLRELSFVRKVALKPRAQADGADIDGRLVVHASARAQSLPCVIHRSHLRREVADHVGVLAKRYPGLVVFAPVVGRALGEQLEQRRVNFIDRAGNCHLRLDAHVARLQGRRAHRAAPTDRALRAPAYRVLFTLLVRPTLLSAPIRELASAAEVSPQTAADLRHRIFNQGIAVQARQQAHWLPERRNDALSWFLLGFTTALAPSLLVGRFRARERDIDELERRIEPLLDAACTWRYGGGAAAMRLTGYYRGDQTTLYVQDPPTDLAARLTLVPDRNGPIAIMRSPTAAAFDSPQPRSVHPLLVYADLLAQNDERAREVAGEVYDAFLKQLGNP